jgi:hypothetical protein
MGLYIYENSTDTAHLSVDDAFSNPLLLTQDGRVGGTVEKKLYVKNNDDTYDYSSIQVYVEQTSGSVDFVNGTKGFYIKLYAGDTQPTLEQWQTISPGNTISLSNISDTATALPFWMKIYCPTNVPVQHIKGVKIVLSATESV